MKPFFLSFYRNSHILVILLGGVLSFLGIFSGSLLLPLFGQEELENSSVSNASSETNVQIGVNDSELSSVEPVEFVNYLGSHDSVDSLTAIKAIGRNLAKLDENSRSDYAGKYSIQHIASEPPGQLFGADILSLSPTARVDHVRNLRHIISSYLELRYKYTQAAADIIATFVTYYNAYYRSNKDYFAQKFSTTVNAALETESIGLSINYADWPGATQIIIPLSANPLLEQDSEPNLDETGQRAIGEYVKEQEQDEQDALELRQNILTLRQEKLSGEQDLLGQKEEMLQEESRETQDALERAQAKLTESEDLNEREAAQQEQGRLTEELQENQREQNELASLQQTIAQRQENLNKEQRELSQEVPVVEETLAEEEALSWGGGVVLLPAGKRFYQFFLIEDNMEIAARSVIDSIRSEDFVEDESGYIVVAGEPNINATPKERKAGGAVRLIRLGRDLQYQSQGTDEIHPQSGVWQNNGELFAFLWNGRLGRFTMGMELLSESEDELLTTTRPQFLDAYLLVQSTKRKFLLLERGTMGTMASKKQLEP